MSGQVVDVSGNLNDLPVVEGPPEPSRPSEAGAPDAEPDEASTGPSSAGSVGPVDPAELPDNFTLDYNALPDIENYSYELAIAISGSGDGDPYQSLIRLEYARANSTNQTRFTLDVTGAFMDQLASEDLAFLESFLPATVGNSGDQGYFYSSTDDLCFDLGDDATLSEVEALSEELRALIDSGELFFLDILPEDAVFGVVDQSGLVGIPGVHYQLLGTQDGDEITPIDELKLDLWWTPDEGLLYGYRFELQIEPDFYFLYRDVLAELDADLGNFNTFDGTLTFYLLPRSSGQAASEAAAPPAACDYFIDSE
ncbi:MAG: hypothetical protein GYB66_14810 [Chloroflexi bacterium]|nr:hypothetical protein [Chloroflexota bacterium]